jgi:hypothetical protein
MRRKNHYTVCAISRLAYCLHSMMCMLKYTNVMNMTWRYHKLPFHQLLETRISLCKLGQAGQDMGLLVNEIHWIFGSPHADSPWTRACPVLDSLIETKQGTCPWLRSSEWGSWDRWQHRFFGVAHGDDNVLSCCCAFDDSRRLFDSGKAFSRWLGWSVGEIDEHTRAWER